MSTIDPQASAASQQDASSPFPMSEVFRCEPMLGSMEKENLYSKQDYGARPECQRSLCFS